MEHILPIVHHSTFLTLEVYIIIVYFLRVCDPLGAVYRNELGFVMKVFKLKMLSMRE